MFERRVETHDWRFPFIHRQHHRPKLGRLIVCILLGLIELTPVHGGIGFNSLK